MLDWRIIINKDLNSNTQKSEIFNSEYLYAEYAQSAELPKKPNSAYSADCAYIESKIKSYGFTIKQLEDFITDDLELYQDKASALIAWADLLHERQLMKQGVVPEDFTAITHCACCGDVFVPLAQANNGSVDGCPWCWNKARGLPVPNARGN